MGRLCDMANHENMCPIRYMQREHHVTTFSPGEESLNSMHYPNAGDREPRYLADGVIRATKLDNLEICLLETSKALGSPGAQRKASTTIKECLVAINDEARC